MAAPLAAIQLPWLVANTRWKWSLTEDGFLDRFSGLWRGAEWLALQALVENMTHSKEGVRGKGLMMGDVKSAIYTTCGPECKRPRENL